MGNQQGQPIPTDDKRKKSKNKNQSSSVVQTPTHQTPKHNTPPVHTKPFAPSSPPIDLLSEPIPQTAGNVKNNGLQPIQANAAPNISISNRPVNLVVPKNSQPPNQNQPPKTVSTRPPVAQQPKQPAAETTSSSEEFLCSQTPQCGTSYSACHLNITGLEQITVECLLETKCINMKADHWLLYVPIPPLTSFQGESKVSVKIPSKQAPLCKKVVDNQGRELLQVVVPVAQHPAFQQGLKIIASFDVSLFVRELFYDPNVQIPYQTATHQELEIATSEGGPYILTNPEFHQYIQSHGNMLFRNPTEIREEAIIYAQRVFHFVSENFSADTGDVADKSILNTIKNKRSDSAGLALLFCSILRCQELPARVVYGRLVKENMKPHAIAEFFIEEVGWIPADIFLMIEKGKKMPKKPDGKLPFFGEQTPTFLALHCDGNFQLDTIKFGIKQVDTLQSFPFWVSGQGDPKSVQSRSSWKEVKRTKVTM